MNAIASLTFAALGVNETDVRLGYKNVAVLMADGTRRAARFRRLALDQSSAALLAYAQTSDARQILKPMLGNVATPEFFDSLAIGETARLANIAMALQLSPEAMLAAVKSRLQELVPAELSKLAENSATKLKQELAGHEGGFHG